MEERKSTVDSCSPITEFLPCLPSVFPRSIASSWVDDQKSKILLVVRTSEVPVQFDLQAKYAVELLNERRPGHRGEE